jgi:transposase-like protein
VSNPVAFLTDERGCADLLRKIGWTRYNRITCIYYHSQHIKKNGSYRSYQKFYCKCCKKNFNDKTDTIFHYSHTPLKKWFMVLYLFFVLWPGSKRLRCGISRHETNSHSLSFGALHHTPQSKTLNPSMSYHKPRYRIWTILLPV